jgi:UDPglucose 6-dehydrogenase
MSLDLAIKLHSLGAKISAYDPVISEKINSNEFIEVKNVSNFFEKLDAVVLMTEWPEFKEIDFSSAGNSMKRKIIFDTKNFFDIKMCEDAKFLYIGTGV